MEGMRAWLAMGKGGRAVHGWTLERLDRLGWLGMLGMLGMLRMLGMLGSLPHAF
jgi:hypothetical protein